MWDPFLVMGGVKSIIHLKHRVKKNENNKEERVTTGRSQSGRDPEN